MWCDEELETYPEPIDRPHSYSRRHREGWSRKVRLENQSLHSSPFGLGMECWGGRRFPLKIRAGGETFGHVNARDAMGPRPVKFTIVAGHYYTSEVA